MSEFFSYPADELDENGYVKGYGPKTEDETTPFLYVAVDGKYCKIGITDNPYRREKQLWYWHPGQRKRRRFKIKYVWYMPRHAGRVETAIKHELRRVQKFEYISYEVFQIKAADMLEAVAKCSPGRLRPMKVSFGVLG